MYKFKGSVKASMVGICFRQGSVFITFKIRNHY